MLLEWTKNLKTEKEKEDFERSLRNSSHVLDRLREIVEQKLATIETKEVAMSVYDSPSWAFQQAHVNGKKEELQFILKLLDI